MASRATAKNIVQVLKTDDDNFEAAFAKLVDRRTQDAENVDDSVRAILKRVREGGHEALIECVKEFDGSGLDVLEVTREEWDEAAEEIDPADRAALGKAAMRVRDFHRKRIPSSWEVREEGGGSFGHRVRPLQRVGIYVPGGRAVYPSTVIMNAVPASVVEVPEIVMATPPGADGRIAPEVLMAARVAGVHRVFKMGGAHAVAAMAFGTETVPRVDKIVGPGNRYVSSAKALVASDCGIDFYAGPTEIVIVSARGPAAWIAADLIAQAEHDPGKCFLVCWSREVARGIVEEVARQLAQRGRSEIIERALESDSAAILVADEEEAVAVADRVAAEHVNLAVSDPERLLGRLRNGGEFFLGDQSPVATGDYYAGPSHCLPTGTTARFASGVSVYTFLKRSGTVYYRDGMPGRAIDTIARLAELEGLDAHAESVRVRRRRD